MAQILIVDDDPAQRMLLHTFLKRRGYLVETASGPPEAVQVLEGKTFDLIITDLMMPYVDGITFVEQLRADPRYKSVPIILITAYATDEIVDKGMRKGVSLTLTKPVDLDKLQALVGFATH